MAVEGTPKLSDPNWVAGRYRLQTELGGGGFAVVWRAEDVVTKTAVAIKIFTSTDRDLETRVRREVLALRLLNVPGVVRLRDEGAHEGRAFLVMDLVVGAPFPGSAPRLSWRALEPIALALLETVARIHAAGILHRDLKPANVLVDRNKTTVLDFGLSRGAALGAAITSAGNVMGTTAYLAAEVLLGADPTPASDLFSVGVMLYQALTGSHPFGPLDSEAFFHRLVSERAAPISERCEDVPAHAAAAIDALLRPVAERPASASDVLRRFSARESDVMRFPWLGSTAVIDRMAGALDAGAGVLLVGPPGSGRTRALNELKQRLEPKHEVCATVPATDPFESLVPVLGELALPADASLTEARRSVDDRLAALLARGVCVIVDNLERIDRWSESALGKAARHGRVVASAAARCWYDVPSEHLHPVSEADIRQVFRGPERLFHIPEDASRLVVRDSGGWPARIVATLDGWTRLGLAQWQHGRLSMNRRHVDQLARQPFTGVAASGNEMLALSPKQRELVRWLRLFHGPVTVASLGRAASMSIWQVEAELSELARVDVVAEEAGRVRLLRQNVGAEPWSPAAQREAHRTIVDLLAPDDPARLVHLLLGRRDTDANLIVEIAIAAAGQHASAGRLDEAHEALADAVNATAGAPPLLRAWVPLAMRHGHSAALDRVAFEVERALPDQRPFRALLAAGRAARTAPGEHARSAVDAVPPFAEVELELERQHARVLASVRCSPGMLVEAVRDGLRWARGRPAARSRAASWVALLRYRQGRFRDAAAWHRRAAELDDWTTTQIQEQFRGAAALMELHDHDEAIHRAEASRDVAASCRAVVEEGWAEWAARAGRYRRGDDLEVDEELLEAVRAIGDQELCALVCFTEGSVAFRRGDAEVARALANEASTAWAQMGKTFTVMIARALAVANGDEASPADVRELHELAEACPVSGLGVQTLGLLARRFPSAKLAEATERLAAALPEKARKVRLDVISADEALQAVRASR